MGFHKKGLLLIVVGLLLLLTACGNLKDGTQSSNSNQGDDSTSQTSNSSNSKLQIKVEYGMRLFDSNQNPIDMTKPVNAVYTGIPIKYYLDIKQYSDYHMSVTGFILVDETMQPFIYGNATQASNTYSFKLNGSNSEKIIGISFTPSRAYEGKQLALSFFEVARVTDLPNGKVSRTLNLNVFNAKLSASNKLEDIDNKVAKNEIAKTFMAKNFSLPKGISISSSFSQQNEEGAKPDRQVDISIDKSKPLYIRACRQPGTYRVFMLIDNVPVKAFNGQYFADWVQTAGKVEEIPVDTSVLPTNGNHDVCLLYIESDQNPVQNFSDSIVTFHMK
jgi:hypothetical protein